MMYSVKLQDFAAKQGVTDRQIQRQLKKYGAELEGLYQRKGPNGTWLSDEACTFLRSKMKQESILVREREKQYVQQIIDLNAQIDRFKREKQEVDKTVEELKRTAENAHMRLTEAHQSFEDELRRISEAHVRELEVERSRKISFKEFLKRRKNS